MDIFGFGVRITAAGDTQLARLNGTDNVISSLLVDGRAGNSAVLVKDGRAELADDRDGGLTVTADQACTQQFWSVAQGDLTCRWPAGMTVWAGDPDAGAWDVEFHGPADSLIVVRGPHCEDDRALPPPDLLCGPGQRLIGMDMAPTELWAEVSYRHDGLAWLQRHQYSVTGPADQDVQLVTGQALKSKSGTVFRAVDEVARSLLLR
ncbi:hypothetical protein ACWKSP_27520 [Micromonosporaceae bacterium Da 78-11]